MSYRYEDLRPRLFTEEGQVMFLEIRDKVKVLLDRAGAFMLARALTAGDTWLMLACFDRLVELGELRELTPPGSCAGQERVFVKGDGRR